MSIWSNNSWTHTSTITDLSKKKPRKDYTYRHRIQTASRTNPQPSVNKIYILTFLWKTENIYESLMICITNSCYLRYLKIFFIYKDVIEMYQLSKHLLYQNLLFFLYIFIRKLNIYFILYVLYVTKLCNYSQ